MKDIKKPFFSCSDHGDPYNTFGTDENQKITKERLLKALTEEDMQKIDENFLKIFGQKKKVQSAFADEDFRDFLM